ncbi:MAG: hypothetical protein JSS66_17975 [Armatimonadetes bacterium]|nr:hypothetical protein [Armatimonadota bacterium]
MLLLAFVAVVPSFLQEASLATAESLLAKPESSAAGRAMLADLVDKDRLKSAAELAKAGALWPATRLRLTECTTKYELTLAAACMGSEEAKKALPGVWDMLMISVDRGQRMGTMKWTDKNFPMPGKFAADPAAACVVQVWKALSRNVPAVDNAEVKALYDADQKVRENFKPNMTMKDMHDMVMGDHQRMKRIREILKKGELRTGKDFENAAFLFQHGERFMDFATAHELSVCSVLLGNKDASWIAGASYDRMMLAASYPQRFGTQYFSLGDKWEFDMIDTSLINDTERVAVIRKTLEQARNQKF